MPRHHDQAPVAASLAFGLVLVALCLHARSGAAAQLGKWVMGAGGGNVKSNVCFTCGDSSSYRIRGTLGQHSVGTSWISYSASVNVGYWFDAASPTTTGLPPVPRSGSFALHPNLPNPFHPLTSIRFTVPEAVRVTIRVHDPSGRLVATITDARFEAGSHSVPFDGARFVQGVYFYRMVAGPFVATRKLVLLE